MFILICIVIASCDNETEEHIHKYDQEVVSDTYLKSAATCTEKAKYYYSCSCGEKGTLTFESGGALGHTGGTATTSAKAVCEVCGKSYGDYKGSEGLEYTLLSDESGYEVTGIGTCTDTNIVIPSTYNDKTVLSIGKSAFYNCTSLTTVYYKGSSTDWSDIAIGNNNTHLTLVATIYYYSESEPTESGNYWHYDSDGNIAI